MWRIESVEYFREWSVFRKTGAIHSFEVVRIISSSAAD